ncbi:hypothetical protein DESUT3_12770 [Desulfuromonas versatilis]|uniref:Lipoprotein n=1 Tax=Desulfuromonas versatilis TaxID=2802975 RepID=A0ABN6DVQ7_9BACT|nr:hypothetical protein [Desulfuromonas versatilis]BCR04208.1 hypothetical protein DESUT3_12770 [Desulfuromonas versatilis]
MHIAPVAIGLALALAACQSGKYLVADANNSSCYLAYDLAADSRLKISSPELNRQFVLHKQLAADPTLKLAQNPETEPFSAPRDLKFTYANPRRGDNTEFKLHFDEESWQLDRALLDSEFLARTWLLETDLRMERSLEEQSPFTLAVNAELTTLLWPAAESLLLLGDKDRPPTLQTPPRFSARQLSRATGSPAGEIVAVLENVGIPAGADEVLDRQLWLQAGVRLGLRMLPAKPRYHGFQKLTLGRTGDEIQRMNYSLGTFLPARLGELTATYRLLHRPAQQPGEWEPEVRPGFYEQALALAYTGHFEGLLRTLGNTLTAYKYTGLDAQPQHAGDGGEFYEKVENRLRLSFGGDPGELLQKLSLVREYRLDLDLVGQRMLAYSEGFTPGADDLAPAWESQLRLKTDLGTWFGRYRQGGAAKRAAFGLEKRGQGASLFKLYCKDIADSAEGINETIVGGGIDVPLDEDFLGFLSLAYWKVSEKDLFSFAPLLAFTSPRQGSHAPTLRTSSPGISQ